MQKAAPETDPSRTQTVAQLERILANELFATAGRLGPFLRYVVEATLEGRSSELKESTIGVGVFGRPPDYDPRTDPIVRVEARRLRSRLAEYYAGPGASDPIIIDLPKGTYVPAFTSRECTQPTLPPADTRPMAWKYIALAALIALGLLAWWLDRRMADPPAASVAVLPFVNLSPERANEYFSDGLTDELIDALSRVHDLRVVGRSLVFQHKGKQYDLQALARQWNVSAVLEGSVRKAGDRIRITAQLTDANSGYNLWSQTYDREVRDVFAIQQEIATSIARALRVQLGGTVKRLEPRPTNLEAYNHYLEARYHFNRFTGESFRLAMKSLDQAIAADPKYAPAYTMLAKIYGLAGYYYVLPPPEAWTKARANAEQALRIDPALGEAHAAVGFVLGLHEWNWSESERAFQDALRLDPASAEVHGAYAVACLMPQARLEEAVAEFRKSLEYEPLSMFPHMGAGFALLALKRYDEALVHYRRALELNSTFPDVSWDTAMALALMGRKEEALRHFRDAGESDGRSPWKPGAAANALLGNHATARQQVSDWERSGNFEPENYMDFARVYGILGDTSNTVKWLEKAWQVREPQLVWLKMDPRFERVRSAPEFQAVMRRLGL